MRVSFATTLLLCAISVAGCSSQATVKLRTRDEFNVEWKKTVSDPKLVQETYDACIKTIRDNKLELETYSLILNAPKEKTPKIACDRVRKAFMSGRYNYEIYVSMSSGQATPEFIRIVQGR